MYAAYVKFLGNYGLKHTLASQIHMWHFTNMGVYLLEVSHWHV